MLLVCILVVYVGTHVVAMTKPSLSSLLTTSSNSPNHQTAHIEHQGFELHVHWLTLKAFHTIQCLAPITRPCMLHVLFVHVVYVYVYMYVHENANSNRVDKAQVLWYINRVSKQQLIHLCSIFDHG